jgi:Secretion system C-terminal sorting domain/Right handed beta helix region
VRSVQGFELGDRVFIDDKRSENGQDIQLGQFRKIVSIDQKNQILLMDKPLDYMFFSRQIGEMDFAEKGLKIYKVSAGGGGIQNLKISRKSPNGVQAANIRIGALTQNVTIQGVESVKCTGAHINIEQSFQNIVRDCYVHDAYDWGANKQAYGVVCEHGAANCLIEDNAFEVLRHAMVVQFGANNNLFRHNIARNSRWNQTFSFIKSGDIQIHGNLAYDNTFENNFVDKIWMDKSGNHLKNGPNNKVVHNPAAVPGFSNMTQSCSELTLLFSTAKIWNNDCEEKLLLVKTSNIPSKAAKIRLERNELVTLPVKNDAQCSSLGFTKVKEISSLQTWLKCTPNPASEFLNMEVSLHQKSLVDLKMVDITGKIVHRFYNNTFLEQGKYVENLNVHQIPRGFYLVVLTQNGLQLTTQKIIIH